MKFTKLMVLALVLALFVCAFVACGDDTETQAPDVTETDAPDTDAPETDPPETEHTHDLEVEEKAATCTDRGYKKEVCKTCGEVVSETAYPKAAHTTTAATCTEDEKCSVCGEVITKATGHTWGDATTVAATCTAEGKETKTCTVCNTTETKTLAKLAHNIPAENVTASVAPTCTTEGSKTGTCTTCNTEQTVVLPAAHVVENLGDLSALTFVDGKIQGKCTSCGADVDVTAEVRLALTFDEADVPTELANWNGLSYVLTHNPDQAGTATKYPPIIATYPDATDGHTSVLQTTHNTSHGIQFKGSLLGDAKYYVISFDWRSTKFGHTSNKIGAFGQAAKALDGNVGEGDFVYAFRVDRSNGDLYDHGNKNKFGAAVANQWYKVVVVVDNESGTAYTYIDGVCVATVKNAKWQITEDGEYTWRFGGLYNVYHVPEFDNFEVSAIVLSTGDVLPGGDDEEGGEEDDDPYNDGSGCAHEVWLDIIPGDENSYGYIVETCKKCNKVVRTYMLIPECEHVSVTVTPTTEATCEVDGEGVAICDTCGAELGVQPIPATGHTILDEDTTEYVASTCVSAGHVTGTCDNCGELVTIDFNLADHVVTTLAEVKVVDGKVQGKCDVCGEFVDVSEDERLVLNFDQGTLKGELNAYGLTTFETYQTANYPTPSGDRTVLFLPHNSSTYVVFDAELLEDANYYVISFDWRATKLGTGTSKQCVFALSQVNGTTVKKTTNFLQFERKSGTFYNANGNAGLFSLVGTAKQWYTVTIVVDNNSGAANVYIDGTLFASYASGYAISESVQGANQFAWRLGGQYNIQHQPEFDNFKVAKLNTVCAHASTSAVEVTPATCTVAGLANTVCDKCGEVVGTEPIPELPHSASTNVVSDLACATVYACTGADNGCTATVTLEKANAVHNVPVPTTFDANTVLADGKIQGTCTVCGLLADADVAEDVRISLDFDAATLADELAEANEAANLANGTTDVEYLAVANANTRYITKDVNGETVLYTDNDTNPSGQGYLFVKYNGTLMADSSYYMISFDWRFGLGGQTGTVNIFSAYGDTTTAHGVNICKFDRANNVFNNGVTYPKDDSTLVVNTWYHFDVIVNSSTGAALVYIDDTYAGTVSSAKFVPVDGVSNHWRFGETGVGHKPQYDNFTVSVLAK